MTTQPLIRNLTDQVENGEITYEQARVSANTLLMVEDMRKQAIYEWQHRTPAQQQHLDDLLEEELRGDTYLAEEESCQ